MKIDLQLSPGAAFVIDRLEKAGYRAWAVGGCVRDSLRGVIPNDFDVTTEALPQETQAVFADCRVVETGLKHGTLTVIIDGEDVEVTTLRTESGYSDGRRPDKVTFVTDLAADLARRDFTINAMAWSPSEGLNDPFGGAEDLQNGLLRCVGEPERRFTEDALRILRGLRFVATLGFSVEQKSALAMRRLAKHLTLVSAERQWCELEKLLSASHAPAVIVAYSDILNAVLLDIIQNPSETELLLSLLPQEGVLRLAAMVGPYREKAAQLAARLKTDRATARRLAGICGMLPSDWPGELTEAAQRLIRLSGCWNTRELAVQGNDLAALGIPEGPEMGRILKRLLFAVADGSCANNREALLSLVLSANL